ncbi:FMN-dependent L-lactate dehydrogenase LldD [Sphingomonas sp. CJ99]
MSGAGLVGWYRDRARKRLPRFLFDYLDGGAGSEATLAANVRDLQAIALNQRVLRDVSDISTATTLLGQAAAMPLALAPVGLTGMYARRGEVQAARAARAADIPITLSTVSVCSLSEVAPAAGDRLWFQLYMIRDRGFMRDLLAEARAQGVTTLMFTVDMPVPGIRHRDRWSGMSGRHAALRRYLQAVAHPRWALDVGLLGRPHLLGNIVPVLERATGLEDFMGWLAANFDPSITWSDLEWLRASWTGSLVIKGILTAEDAREAARLGADGIVVSNHGGRQLDGATSTARALSEIADAVRGRLTVLADSGIRSGADILRMLALGADGVLIGRAFVYALAAGGQAGIADLLDSLKRELAVSMALCGVRRVEAINASCLK